MKKLLVVIVFLSVLFLTSCENAQNVKQDINLLKSQRTSLDREVNSLKSTVSSKRTELSQINTQLKEANLIKSGKQPVYLVMFELKQSHFSLSISKHLKDATNKISFPIPVSKEYYDQIRVGQEIVDDFRMGSMIFRGSFGHWKVKVVSKQIK